MKHPNRILLLIIVSGFLIRLVMLNRVPPSASLDEASIGYNAYSILKTGHDEYGYRLPLLLRAYDDWRPATYVYLTVPFVAVFGLNVVSVRLPSVILGTLSIWLIFLWVRLVFDTPGKKQSVDLSWVEDLPLISAFLLAISPWLVYQNRLGHEANLSLPVLLGAMILLLKSFHRKLNWLLIPSMALFAVSLVTYQNLKLITPLVFLALFWFYRHEIKLNLKWAIPSFVVGLLILLPILTISLSPEGLTRFTGTSIFNGNSYYDSRVSTYVQAKAAGNTMSVLINHPRLVQMEIILKQYLMHFNPKWLFSGGSYESFKIPDQGLLYLWQLPLIIIGLFALLYGKSPIRSKMILLVLLFTAPIPASITTQAPHAMRAGLMVLPLSILSGIGILAVREKLSGNTRLIVAVLAVLLVVCELYRTAGAYFTVFPYTQSRSFQYALQQSIGDITANSDRGLSVVISNQDNLYQSYMFYLFGSRYDPALYQQAGGSISGGYDADHRIGNLNFRRIIWTEDRKRKNTVFFGNSEDFSGQYAVLGLYKYLDGTPGIVAVQLQ